MDCRRVEVGVIGERKDTTISKGPTASDPGITYVKLVVEAS